MELSTEVALMLAQWCADHQFKASSAQILELATRIDKCAHTHYHVIALVSAEDVRKILEDG